MINVVNVIVIIVYYCSYSYPYYLLFMQVTPDDASLLCALGDITLDDKHYQKAWDMSQGRSTRAQRSLARSAQRQQHWEEVGSFAWTVAWAVADDHS